MKISRPVAILLASSLLLVAGLVASCNNGNGGGAIVGVKELNSGDLAHNQTFQHTFASAGSFAYHCVHHGGMNGTVVVVNGGADAPAVSITDNVFTPATLTVAPGTMVTWTNNGNNPHTVTRN